MKNTKRLTLSAMLVALGITFMTLGYFVPVMDLSAAALASLMVAFAYIEIGSPYTWLIWLCTTLLCFVLFQGSPMWLTYLLVFGLYPILKGYIERAKRGLWLPFKLIYANAAIALGVFIFDFLMGEAILGDASVLAKLPPYVIWGGLLLVANLAFLAYDLFMTVLIRFYFAKLRPRFKNLLK